MPKEHATEQFWKLYEKLPQELKEAIFAEETASNIFDICVKNGVEDERISEVARYVGRVLLGVLPQDEFQGTIEKEVKLERDSAKKIAQGIYRFIFYPVKPALEELYKIKATPPRKPISIPPAKKTAAEILSSIKKTEVTPEVVPEKTRKDIYRESIK